MRVPSAAATRAPSSSARCSWLARSTRSSRRSRASARSRPSSPGWSCRAASSSASGALYVATPKQITRYDGSRTSSTARRSRSMIYTSCRATSRTAGSSCGSGRTGSSTCRWARPATSASQMPRSTRRSSASMPTAAAGRSWPRRAQHGGLRFPSHDQAAVLHRQPARLALGGHTARRAQRA